MSKFKILIPFLFIFLFGPLCGCMQVSPSNKITLPPAPDAYSAVDSNEVDNLYYQKYLIGLENMPSIPVSGSVLSPRERTVVVKADAFFVINENSDLVVWGCNDRGTLPFGDSSFKERKIFLTGIAAVDVSSFGGLALDSSGNLYSWPVDEELAPVEISADKTYAILLKDVVDFSLGDDYGGAVLRDGSLWMWGYNDYGQLGNGNSNVTYSDPTTTQKQPAFKCMDNVARVYCDVHSTIAVTKDGELYAWGNRVQSSAPVLISKDVSQLPVNRDDSIAPAPYHEYLSPAGELLKIFFDGSSNHLVCTNVRQRVPGGFITNDGTLWKNSVTAPQDIINNVVDASVESTQACNAYITVDGLFHITDAESDRIIASCRLSDI